MNGEGVRIGHCSPKLWPGRCLPPPTSVPLADPSVEGGSKPRLCHVSLCPGNCCGQSQPHFRDPPCPKSRENEPLISLPPTTVSSPMKWLCQNYLSMTRERFRRGALFARGQVERSKRGALLLTLLTGKTTASLALPASRGCQPSAHYYSRYEFEVAQRVPKVIMGRGQHSLALLFWTAGSSQEMKVRTGSSCQPQTSTGRALCPVPWAASKMPDSVRGDASPEQHVRQISDV